MSDTRKLMVWTQVVASDGVPDLDTREATVPEVVAWLRRQGAGSELSSSDNIEKAAVAIGEESVGKLRELLAEQPEVLVDLAAAALRAVDPLWKKDPLLLSRLERWFHRLGSDDPKWWAKEIHAYLTKGDALEKDHV